MLKIMVIDDDYDDRFFFREAVACMGEDYSFIEASSGTDALNQFGLSIAI